MGYGEIWQNGWEGVELPRAATKTVVDSRLCIAGPTHSYRAGRASRTISIYKSGYGGASARQILDMPSVHALAFKCKACWSSAEAIYPLGVYD